MVIPLLRMMRKALSDDAKRKKLDEIWGADGKADDTATNAPKGYYMKYDANKGTFVNISADGAVPRWCECSNSEVSETFCSWNKVYNK